MKIKQIGWLLCLLALLVVVSCKSAPATETEALAQGTEAPAQEKAVTGHEALDAAQARALAARKLVSDFEGDRSFPNDWRAANSLMTEADQGKNTSSTQAVAESAARYTKAAEAYDGMSGKVLARYYETKSAELLAARNAAVKAGAEELVPELLLEADNTVALADKKYETRDYYGAKDSAAGAAEMYAVLKTGLEAYAIREAIAERNLAFYDPKNVELADEALNAAVEAYSANNMAGAREKVEAAKLHYNQALTTAWVSYAADQGAEAADERQAALDVRADVASRQEFNAAQEVFNRASSSFRAQRFDEAAKSFENSISLFRRSTALTLNKRATAERALERANQVLADSDEIARNAEIILEGGEE